MEKLIEILKDNGPQLLQWAISLGLGVGGGAGVVRLALKKQRRVMANLQRPIMVIGTDEGDMVDQARLLKEIDLFNVSDLHRGEKATDFLKSEHRLLVLGYSKNPSFKKAFDSARNRQIPVLVYAKPGAVPQDGMAEISGYSYASICNTDLRLVSDVFTLMSTFPEK